jgi:anaerobic selenocysteine-containing dehydrogenase
MARPVIPPMGETRSNLAIFQDLAGRFGFKEDVFMENEERIIQKLLTSDSPYLDGVTFERLNDCRPVRLQVPENPLAAGFRTPSGKVEFYSQSMADQGLDPLPDGSPSVDPDGQGRYPLQLISPPRHQFLNSTFNEVDHLRGQAGRPSIMLHPLDASARKIKDGAQVRVFNDRGECFLFAMVTDVTSPGVTVVEGLYWPRFMPNKKGVNQLTSQRLTDMGKSCAFHCNLVEVECTVN